MQWRTLTWHYSITGADGTESMNQQSRPIYIALCPSKCQWSIRKTFLQRLDVVQFVHVDALWTLCSSWKVLRWWLIIHTAVQLARLLCTMTDNVLTSLPQFVAFYQACRRYDIFHPYPYPQIFCGYPWIYPYLQIFILRTCSPQIVTKYCSAKALTPPSSKNHNANIPLLKLYKNIKVENKHTFALKYEQC